MSEMENSRPGAPTDLRACFIIPTFNRAEALLLCLDHLERQTLSAFEVIVVDDGSTDATAKEMERYLTRTALRLRYVRQQNSGPARARNLAVTMTSAPICIIIGDDILCAPDFTATHLRLHNERPEINVAALGFTRWSQTLQTVTPFMRWMDESGSQFAYGDLLSGTKPEWRHFYTSNLSVKTELLRRHRFNEKFSGARWMMEDMELGYRLQKEVDLQIVFLPNATAEHVHPTDFRKACKRAYGAGLSSRLFDELWPDRPVTPHGRMHLFTRDLLASNAWLLPPAAAITQALTSVWCPNPLMRPVLAFHTAVGRKRG
jgi:glycosyltransferase involved in cell wall biosynthesis